MEQVITVTQLAQHVGAQIQGDALLEIKGIASIKNAEVGELTFLANEKFSAAIDSTRASAIIVRPTYFASHANKASNKTWLLVEDPYLAYAQITALFCSEHSIFTGIHSSAVVAETVSLGKNVRVGPNTVIDGEAIIDDNVCIGAACYIGKGSKIGAGSVLHAQTTLYSDVTIGENCIIHSGCVLGSDGFGFANQAGSWVKIHQLGGVSIGNEVEIGANTCIDRGALEDTCIKDGVKIDNMCHVAHNVEIGENTAIAGATAIAGSTVIGRNCVIGGGVGIIGHLVLADRVMVCARSFVNTSVKEVGAVVSSGTVLQDAREWRKSASRFKKLDDMYRKIIQLEKQVKSLQDDNNR